LYCGGNPLTSLDLSKCPNLIELNAPATQISTLDMRNLKKIESIYIPACPINNITIDAAPNSYPAFREFDIPFEVKCSPVLRP
jgi:hypothetical protein